MTWQLLDRQGNVFPEVDEEGLKRGMTELFVRWGSDPEWARLNAIATARDMIADAMGATPKIH